VAYEVQGDTILPRQEVETATGIQKELEVTLAGAGTDVTLVHRLTNRGLWPVRLAAWSILLEFWAKAKTEPEVATSMVGTLRRYQAMFEGILERGVSEGSLRAGDASVGASLLLSVVLGTLLQGLLDPQGGDWAVALQRELAQVMTWTSGRDT
jgi:hypothetical protein